MFRLGARVVKGLVKFSLEDLRFLLGVQLSGAFGISGLRFSCLRFLAY